MNYICDTYHVCLTKPWYSSCVLSWLGFQTTRRRHLMLEGARPHMNDVRVINESPEQCWGFSFPILLE